MIYVPEIKKIINEKGWTTEFSKLFFKNQIENSDKLQIFGSGLAAHGFLIKGNDLFGFGRNGECQLGVDDSQKEPLKLITFFKSKKVRKVCVGWNHSLFFTKDNFVYASGSNRRNQLLLSGTSTVRQTVKQPRIVDCENIIDIFVGEYHSLLLNRSLKAFSGGYNYYGQLGVGDKKNKEKPTKVIVPEKIISISCGANFSCFFTLSGSVYVTGRNTYGEIGMGDPVNYLLTPQKILFFKNKRILQISNGEYHTFYHTSDGVYGCGLNGNGEIGCGNNKEQLLPVLVSSLKNEKITFVKCGAHHSFFRSKNKMWMTGFNNCKQFGTLYDKNESYSPVEFTIKGKKVVQTLMMINTSIHITETNEIYGSGYSCNNEIFSKGITSSRNRLLKICDLKIKRFKDKNGDKESLERFEYLNSVERKVLLIF